MPSQSWGARVGVGQPTGQPMAFPPLEEGTGLVSGPPPLGVLGEEQVPGDAASQEPDALSNGVASDLRVAPKSRCLSRTVNRSPKSSPVRVTCSGESRPEPSPPASCTGPHADWRVLDRGGRPRSPRL